MDNTTSNTSPDRGARLSSPDIFESPQVRLVVGSEGVVLHAHESHLLKVPFFAAELTNVALESIKTITLSDFGPNEIKCGLHYLYHGDVERALNHVGMLTDEDQKLMERVDDEAVVNNLDKPGDAALGSMADIWLCGSRLEFRELQNAVMSVMYERAKCVTLGGFGGEALERIFARTPEFSKVRWFAIGAEIDSLLCRWSHDLLGGYIISKEVYRELIQEFFDRATTVMDSEEVERAFQAARM